MVLTHSTGSDFPYSTGWFSCLLLPAQAHPGLSEGGSGTACDTRKHVCLAPEVQTSFFTAVTHQKHLPWAAEQTVGCRWPERLPRCPQGSHREMQCGVQPQSGASEKMNVGRGGKRERVKLERRRRVRPLSRWGREGPGAAVPPGRCSGSSAQTDSAVLAGSIQPTPSPWDGTGCC